MKEDIKFYIYNENLGDWEIETFTLRELSERIKDNENPTICPIKEDGQAGQPIPYRQYVAALLRQSPLPIQKVYYTYEVITHNVYKKNKFDALGFKKKINKLAADGYRLVTFGNVSGFPESEEAMEQAVINSVFDGNSVIHDYKIAVAIMEKEIVQFK